MSENTIADLEGAIVARLKARVPACSVKPYPDDPRSYRMQHPRGEYLVVYSGGEYSELEDTAEDDVVQERTLLFTVGVLARNLATHDGAYVLLEAARLALTGHRAAGFKPLTPRKEVFLSQKDGVWVFALTFAARTMTCTLLEDEADTELARLRRLTFNNPSAGNPEVTGA